MRVVNSTYNDVEKMLAFHGAPTLEGIKSGSLISFNKQRIKNCQEVLDKYKTCMECKGLYFLYYQKRIIGYYCLFIETIF